MASASLVFIRIAHRDADTLINEATIAFSKDFATFAKSNNRGDIEVTIKELKKSGQDKAYAEAVTEGYKAANLVTGYIGAKSGKFADQPDDVQLTFNSAIDRFTEAFKQSLIDSGLFINPTPKTADEKAKVKAEKAEKAEKAKSELINSLVQSGELIRSIDVKRLEDMGMLPLIDALKVLGMDVEVMQSEYKALQADHAALQADHAALQADHAALQIAKTKVKKIAA